VDGDCPVGQCFFSICQDFQCVRISLQDSLPCDDQDACTHDDACRSGNCAGFANTCNDFNPCTIDTCDSKSGCLYELVSETCGTAEGNPLLATADPTPEPLWYSLPPVTLPTPPPPPPSNLGLLSAPIVGQVEEQEPDTGAPVGPPPGESNNEVLAAGGFNYTVGLMGVSMVACAGLLALGFGGWATQNMHKEDVDRLDVVLEINDTTMDAPVDNPAFRNIHRPL